MIKNIVDPSIYSIHIPSTFVAPKRRGRVDDATNLPLNGRIGTLVSSA
jgi:hypothetical protein